MLTARVLCPRQVGEQDLASGVPGFPPSASGPAPRPQHLLCSS